MIMPCLFRTPVVVLLTALVPSAGAQSPTETPRTISTRGNAAVQVVPDEIVLTLGVETDALEVAAARVENDRRTRAIIKAAAKHGIAQEHVQTDYLSIDPRWETPHNAARRFLGYWCTKTVVLRLKDLQGFEPLLSDCLAAGANYVHGIEFRTTELRKHRDEARRMAIRAAREKAVDLARELGLSVGPARTVSEGYVDWSMPAYGGGRRHGGGNWLSQNNAVVVDPNRGSSHADAPLAPGQINITAEISATFDLITSGTASLANGS